MAALPDQEEAPQGQLRSTGRQLPFSGPRTVMALILREMSSSYGRSPGGYAWMILEPVLGIMVLASFFALVGIRTPPLGTSFAMFMATGLLPFGFYGDLSNKTASAINYSKSLLSYPRVTYMDAILARALLAVLTQLLVGALILTALRLLFETRTIVVIDRILLSYAMAAALGVGVGLFNCFLITQFPLWGRAWNIINRPLFFVSGIILITEQLPPPWNEYFLWNPLVHVTAEMRGGFYVGYEAAYVDPGYVFTIALVLGLTGLVFLKRYHRDLLEL
ncbi:ABC transporter permease [Jannaschia seohaensis]|uniref:Transport permease protein n=1 Tax=Jannaschia seohaensis TaxID=475081 RepID=A0A2Y9B3Z6_9RHOB|nr:ABC transporter permease [Jannaschia seohaensis]PWJ12917.1 capsular polysaccharide transport system permease protein [Jannaschia seohaensis]SSA50725.1 capsular polysaccharide transport system permease protein [Jannaschia seohaensis]